MKKTTTTLKEIALNLKLSVSTVSRSLNDNKSISKLTKEKVRKEAERLGYIPNVLAKNFRNKKTKIIGVIVPSITHNFTGEILKGILLESERIGYRTVISETNNNPEREKKILDEMLQFGVDGILMSLSNFTKDLSSILLALQKKTLILFDKVSDKVPCTHVVVNEASAAFNVMEHLISIGKKRIAIVKEYQNSFNSEKRLQGYIKALKKYNLPVEEKLILSVKESTVSEGEKLTKKLLLCKDKPDAIFCITDCLAIGVIKVLKEYKVRIPEEIAVVGFSNSNNTTIIEPNLTTVDQPGYSIGRLAVKQIVKEIDNKEEFFLSKSIEINTKLIIRESTVA